MDFEKFRRTGELSDITVIVDKTELKLHKFPLFTKSNYFKKAITSASTPYVIRLENNFPSGAEVFNQLADYFYSILIAIDRKNITHEQKYDLTIPLLLLERCTGEYQIWAKQTHMVDKCLDCIIELLNYYVDLQINKSDREIIVRLPFEWIIELIKLCPTEGDTLKQFSLVWLNSIYEKAVELKCESEPTLSSYITQAIFDSTDLDNGIENIPDDVMTRLLERLSKHKEEHIKDSQLLAKLSSLIDSYVEQKQRNSHDTLLLALDNLLKNGCNDEREELLNQVNFSRINEETIVACKSNKLIPQQLITDATLALCVKLRKQLEQTRNRLHLVESELAKSRLTYTNSSKSRSRNFDSSFRLPSRSRTTYTNTYDLPESNLTCSYSKYNHEGNFDYALPSKYLSSSSSRYGSSYNYRY
ncbi:unnamed protein product [Rotaria sp. Silwood2]|nr:unnamed protein product [Rotaria sp. Silwood2]CAF3989759.1 unnamed protein product [Rotaria sp. Silwood2]